MLGSWFVVDRSAFLIIVCTDYRDSSRSQMRRSSVTACEVFWRNFVALCPGEWLSASITALEFYNTS